MQTVEKEKEREIVSPYGFAFERATCGIIDLKPNEIKGTRGRGEETKVAVSG